MSDGISEEANQRRNALLERHAQKWAQTFFGRRFVEAVEAGKIIITYETPFEMLRSLVQERSESALKQAVDEKPLEFDWDLMSDDGFAIAQAGYCELSVSPAYSGKEGEWVAVLGLQADPHCDAIELAVCCFEFTSELDARRRAEALPHKEVNAQLDAWLQHKVGDALLRERSELMAEIDERQQSHPSDEVRAALLSLHARLKARVTGNERELPVIERAVARGFDKAKESAAQIADRMFEQAQEQEDDAYTNGVKDCAGTIANSIRTKLSPKDAEPREVQRFSTVYIPHADKSGTEK